jgi:maltose alpha-D-glucosyltransferase/alpha-amylase
MVIRDGLAKALSTSAHTIIEDEALPQYIAKRRWFGLKDQTIERTRITYLVNIGDAAQEILLNEVEVKTNGAKTRWLLPLSVLWEDEPSAALPNRLAVARVRRGRRLGLLTDAFALPAFARRFIVCLAAGKKFEYSDGVVRFQPTEAGRKQLEALPDAEVNWLAAEQSNSSLTIGDAVMLKIYRRITPGEHPEAEMERYLTAHGFSHAPPLLGDVVRVASDGTPFTLAIALGFVRNEGDAWSWILDHLTRALDALSPGEVTEGSEADLLADCEAVVTAIGRRLGEMHGTLARETSDPTFAPKVADAEDAAHWARKTEERIELAFDGISRVQKWEREQDRERAKMLSSSRQRIVAAARSLAKSGAGALMTRIHGDFHLGQVLVASGDAYIIDFEGEPATSIAERRAKTSPLRDVAGLLRSIDYAGATLIDRKGVGAMPVDEAQRSNLITQFRQRASSAFLRAYWQASGSRGDAAARALLDLFLIEKAAYEIAYEAANRPTWIGVPLAGLTRLATRIFEKEAGGRNG